MGVVDREGRGIDRLAVEQVNARPIQRTGARRARRKRGSLPDFEIAIDDQLAAVGIKPRALCIAAGQADRRTGFNGQGRARRHDHVSVQIHPARPRRVADNVPGALRPDHIDDHGRAVRADVVDGHAQRQVPRKARVPAEGRIGVPSKAAKANAVKRVGRVALIAIVRRGIRPVPRPKVEVVAAFHWVGSAVGKTPVGKKPIGAD